MAANKKGTITEEDVSVLLQRYSANTILIVLQEISQVCDVKIDWNELVKRTTTGITCPKEYQMIWRHLAYRRPLEENVEVGAPPLDDDSDLEFEVEASPPVSTEASAEAAACVKVLMSSRLSNENTANYATVEAPLTINIPDGQTSTMLSDKQQLTRSSHGGLNITIPVSVQKQPLPAVAPAGVEGSELVGSKQPSKKKRKTWSKEEDLELIAAVQKCGEGNWQNILKEDFKHDRTASQLSQRWSILRKNNSKSASGSNSNPNNPTLSEAQLSARQAISRALNMPIGSLSAISSGMHTNTSSNSILPPTSSEASPVVAQKAPYPSQSVQQATSQKGIVQPQNKSKIIPAKPPYPAKPSAGPNPLIQKAAIAAGGRIVNPATITSLYKVAHSKNAVHIRPRGALTTSQAPNTKPSPPSTQSGSHPSTASQNRIAPAHTSISVAYSGSGSQQTTLTSSRPSSQNFPSTNTSVRPPQSAGDQKSVPMSDNAGAIVVLTASVSLQADVEHKNQVKIDNSCEQDMINTVNNKDADALTDKEATKVNLDVAECEKVVDSIENNQMIASADVKIVISVNHDNTQEEATGVGMEVGGFEPLADNTGADAFMGKEVTAVNVDGDERESAANDIANDQGIASEQPKTPENVKVNACTNKEKIVINLDTDECETTIESISRSRVTASKHLHKETFDDVVKTENSVEGSTKSATVGLVDHQVSICGKESGDENGTLSCDDKAEGRTTHSGQNKVFLEADSTSRTSVTSLQEITCSKN